ncbi:hypothetical protein vseg_005928 [Gypsophila vaccaria]
MQKKLESFFKHSSTLKSTPNSSNSIDLFGKTRSQNLPEIRVKYTRESLDSHQFTRDLEEEGTTSVVEIEGEKSRTKMKTTTTTKKRSYAQFHLELGQSDFLLHSCKVCGIKYAKGDEVDEKVHRNFHKNFTHGVSFKGWRHESVIDMPLLEKDRVILVSNSDPPAQRKKVEEVVKMMEIELGDGWIFHKLCKVYLYVLSQRIAGCVVVEPINTAHKVLSNSMDRVSNSDASRKEAVSKPSTLRFGEICFQREVSKKGAFRRNAEALDSDVMGTIFCEEEAIPASCGIRAVWVTPSNRRKHIATHLLDAVRKNFSTDGVLEHSQLAFSQPTSTGKALALKYFDTGSFLVYRAS